MGKKGGGGTLLGACFLQKRHYELVAREWKLTRSPEQGKKISKRAAPAIKGMGPMHLSQGGRGPSNKWSYMTWYCILQIGVAEETWLMGSRLSASQLLGKDMELVGKLHIIWSSVISPWHFAKWKAFMEGCNQVGHLPIFLLTDTASVSFFSPRKKVIFSHVQRKANGGDSKMKMVSTPFPSCLFLTSQL